MLTDQSVADVVETFFTRDIKNLDLNSNYFLKNIFIRCRLFTKIVKILVEKVTLGRLLFCCQQGEEEPTIQCKRRQVTLKEGPVFQGSHIHRTVSVLGTHKIN